MKRIIHLGTFIFLLIGLFANSAMAQKVQTWTGATNGWNIPGNWSQTGATFNPTGAAIVGATLITVASTADLTTGDTVTGNGIPASTTLTVNTATTFTLSNALTVAVGTTSNLTFIFVTPKTGAVPTIADGVVINNNSVTAPVISTAAQALRLTISNAVGTTAGPILTINPTFSLTITGNGSSNLVLNGGSIINNGSLVVTTNGVGFTNFPAYGITCGNPTVLPSTPTEYGISGGGTLSITLSAANFNNSAAIAVTGNSGTTTTPTDNANVTYKIVLNNPTITLGPSAGATIAAIRTAGGNNANKLIIAGTGLTMGTVGTPMLKPSLIILSGGAIVTVDSGTTLTQYVDAASATATITLFSSGTAFTTNLTNNGTINILGASTRSGLNFSTGVLTAGPPATTARQVFNFTNNGTFNVNMNIPSSNFASIGTSDGGGYNVDNAFRIVNTGVMSLTNTGTGTTIFASQAYNAPPLTLTNSGTLNLNGATSSGSPTFVNNPNIKASINNSGLLTSNNEIANVAFTNSSSGTVAFVNAAAGATTSALVTGTFATNNGKIQTGSAKLNNLGLIGAYGATSVIEPGGTGKGIANFNKTGSAVVLGKLVVQVDGNTTAGTDYDQITNSFAAGGFDVTGAILEITSLYIPGSNVAIPIVTVSGAGTISGPFASVTGLTPGWALDYLSPTAVNLVYTIPTIWTGLAADNDFFNEANWKDSVTNVVPAANTINPGANINLHLQINSAAATITSGIIQFGTGSLAISSANLSATSLSGGTVTVNDGGYIALSAVAPLLNNVQINFTSGIGWIRTPNYNARAVSDNNIGQIKVNNINAVYANNLRLDHYYLNGCVIRANLAATAPLTVYDSANRVGSSAAITVNTIHSSDAIANNMNNKIESFILKKGFMATFAIENDGTGKSKNYIASEADLVINVLPQTLQNSISFIRVMPWNWVTKKGFNSPVDSNLDVSWRYQWNPNDSSTLDWEFAPMAWGHTSANDPSDVALFVGKYNSPYVMSFNEPDDCDGQSGQYGDLCQTDVAVGYHKNLMKTGMRIVSPGGREEAPFGWLKTFYDKATAQDIRVDVIAVHWYDWGSNPTVNTNPTAQQVFDRFEAYLTNVHNLYGLPIWITEFNANPARSQAINAGFLALALPYLESLDYIERYCWFPYNTGTHFTGWDDVNNVPSNTTPTLVGTIYKNINNTTPVNSTPAIPEATVNAGNSLDLSNNPNVALGKPATSSSAWNGNVASRAVDGDTTSTDSRWLVEFATSPLPAWIEVNLQGSFTIDSFRIFEGSNAVRNFRFEVWDATLNSGTGGWSTALTIANNPSTPLTTYWTITPVATTRVRLNITAPHNDSGYIRMFELEVYGLKNNPTWTGGTSTVWTTAANWSTGIVPDQFSNVLINGGATFQPTISATTTINFLAIAAGATLTVTAPNFTVKGAIDNDGTMSLANNSNLLQGEEFNPNSGNISINRSSSALSRLDYTIWSSPVENQNLLAFSPATSLSRFYNYNQTSNLYNAIANPATTAFGLAAGNLIRMPNTHPTTPTVWNGTFTGVPNNGTITRVVTYKNEAPLNFGYNMIGNPYPSTLNANAFIAENTTKIENILYFWRKTNGALGSAYATWISGTGGTASAAGSATPNGTIQVGQGFFVRAKPGTNLALLTFNQTLTFKNAMRLGNTSTQFFKTKQVEKDRVWLNLTTTSGVFSQALIGYIPEATMGVDDFDGRYINDSPIALTSNINNEEYTIQGRPTFDPSDVVALNFKTDIDGDYTIALDHFDGAFSNGQDVYLVDSKTGVETDLKASAYTFTAATGVDNARFSLKYQKTLKIDAPAFNENSVRVYKNNGTLYVNSGVVGINNIKVYDIQGRLIAEQKNVKATTASIKDLKATHQVFIVKVTGEDNSVVSKKVVY